MSTVVGITGHQSLPHPQQWEWVEAEMRSILADARERETGPPVTGISALAAGADQRFANLVLAVGGTLVAIIPMSSYGTRFASDADRRRYEHLRARAVEVEVLPDTPDDEDAYLQAGKRVVDRAEWIIAVWDGRPARGKGGTADAVEYARFRGKRVYQLNPDTKIRTRYDGGAPPPH